MVRKCAKVCESGNQLAGRGVRKCAKVSEVVEPNAAKVARAARHPYGCESAAKVESAQDPTYPPCMDDGPCPLGEISPLLLGNGILRVPYSKESK